MPGLGQGVGQEAGPAAHVQHAAVRAREGPRDALQHPGVLEPALGAQQGHRVVLGLVPALAQGVVEGVVDRGENRRGGSPGWRPGLPRRGRGGAHGPFQ